MYRIIPPSKLILDSNLYIKPIKTIKSSLQERKPAAQRGQKNENLCPFCIKMAALLTNCGCFCALITSQCFVSECLVGLDFGLLHPTFSFNDTLSSQVMKPGWGYTQCGCVFITCNSLALGYDGKGLVIESGFISAVYTAAVTFLQPCTIKMI